MKRVLLFALLFAAFAIPAHAIKPGGSNLIFPIVGRFAGAYGTQWKTDVFVRFPYHTDPPVLATMTLYVQGGAPLQSTFTIGSYATMTFHDIVKTRFGLDNAAGQLRITTDGWTLEARARIYNTGNPAGEFGQGVPALDSTLLQRQASIFGLDGMPGRRVNAGVANPNDVAVDVVMRVSDGVNNHLWQEVFTLQPHETRQFNDIFGLWGIPPQESVNVEFNTPLAETPIYGYTSEVRNDTGDAVFTFGTSPNS